MGKNSTSTLQTCKSRFDASLKVVFKKERKTRKNKLVRIESDGEKYYGVNKENQRVLLNGEYAFVTLLSDDDKKTIHAWPKETGKHNDTAHFALAKYAQEVLYAGEAQFTPLKKSQVSKCKMFNNASGCYRPKETNKDQAGLPVKKFVAPNFPY